MEIDDRNVAMPSGSAGRRLLNGLMGICLACGVVLAILFVLPSYAPSLHDCQSLSEPEAASYGDEPLRPIPGPTDLDEHKVALGERLFNDARLSHDNTISCATCHLLERGGADRLPRSIGINRATVDRNAPTVFNCSLNFKQFWDGRADTLEDQIDFPLTHPREMGSSWQEVTGKLRADDGYRASFGRLYASGIQASNIKDAIATYERSLLTPNARFDRYLRGDADAITAREKEGYRLFKAYGCVSCHQGVGVGGNMFGTVGVMKSYFTNDVSSADFGRFKVTGEEFDQFRFKVPSLRNIAVTSPYFHDGSAESLAEAVNVMAKFQLGRQLSAEETDLIVLFLETLTGEYKGKQLQ